MKVVMVAMNLWKSKQRQSGDGEEIETLLNYYLAQDDS